MKVLKQNFTLALVLSIILLIPNIILAFNSNVWMDEIFTVKNCTSDSIPELISWAKRDVHPPLYYIMVRIVSILTGESLIAMKLLSVVGHFVILMCGLFFVNKQFGFRTMIIYDLFVTVMPGMYTYSVEIRMYQWAMCFVVLCSISAYFVMTKGRNRDWVMLCITALLCAYTHYYALACAAFIFGIVLLWICVMKERGLLKAYVFCAIFTIIGYMPWVPVLLGQIQGVNNGFWIELKSVEYYLIKMFDCSVPYSRYINYILVIGAIFVLLIKRNEMKREVWIWSIGCISALPIIFGIVYCFSIIFSPIIIFRYLLIVIMLLAIGMSVAFKYVPKTICGIVVIFYIYCGVVQYQEVYREQFVNTNETIEKLSELNTDIIYSEIPAIEIYLDFYGIKEEVKEWHGKLDSNVAILISDKIEDEIYMGEKYAIENVGPLQFKTVSGYIYKLELKE